MSAWIFVLGCSILAATAAGAFVLARNIEKKKTFEAILAAQKRMDAVRVNTVRNVSKRMRGDGGI